MADYSLKRQCAEFAPPDDMIKVWDAWVPAGCALHGAIDWIFHNALPVLGSVSLAAGGVGRIATNSRRTHATLMV
jgi:hypothetical protein